MINIRIKPLLLFGCIGLVCLGYMIYYTGIIRYGHFSLWSDTLYYCVARPFFVYALMVCLIVLEEDLLDIGFSEKMQDKLKPFQLLARVTLMVYAVLVVVQMAGIVILPMFQLEWCYSLVFAFLGGVSALSMKKDTA